jgi:hypothetical protein
VLGEENEASHSYRAHVVMVRNHLPPYEAQRAGDVTPRLNWH